MNDRFTQLAPKLERIMECGAENDDLYDVQRREYQAFWENPANRQRPEFTLLVWNRHFNCLGVDYPFMRQLNFINGAITFLYEGFRFTLKGRHLRDLYLRSSDHRPKHLQEYNPDYHDAVADDALCIETISVEEL